MIDTGRSADKPHSQLERDVERYWRQKGWHVVRELDLASRSLDKEVKIADIFAMSPMYPPKFVICEIKVSRADLLSDIKSEKYLHSMENCYLFYFAAPFGLITEDDLPFGCGRLEQWENGKGFNPYDGEKNNNFKMSDELWHNFARKLDQ